MKEGFIEQKNTLKTNIKSASEDFTNELDRAKKEGQEKINDVLSEIGYDPSKDKVKVAWFDDYYEPDFRGGGGFNDPSTDDPYTMAIVEEIKREAQENVQNEGEELDCEIDRIDLSVNGTRFILSKIQRVMFHDPYGDGSFQEDNIGKPFFVAGKITEDGTIERTNITSDEAGVAYNKALRLSSTQSKVDYEISNIRVKHMQTLKDLAKNYRGVTKAEGVAREEEERKQRLATEGGEAAKFFQ